jgi:hypothetical protein
MRGEVRDRILRVLLNNPSGTMSRYRIAKDADSTYPWVREFFSKLTEMGLVRDTRVVDYPAIFRYWNSISPGHKYREYMTKEPLKLLKGAKLPYALTTYLAENLVKGYLFPSRADVYIKAEDRVSWHETLSKKGLVGRGNFRLLLSDEHIFYKSLERDGIKVVSIPQLIVDLLKEGGVCVEAAELLIEEMQRHV